MSKTKIIAVGELSREEWLTIRRKYIGGSDAAAVVGLSPYQSQYSLWADKKGMLPPKEETEAMKVGTELENYVAIRFMEKSGKKVRRSLYMWGNSQYPWASANIDREVIGERAFMEAKTASVLNLKKFQGGNFPTQYYAQCVHYLAVTEFDRAYLAVLILGKAFLIYQLTRVPNDVVPDWCEDSVFVSDDEIKALMREEHDFWRDYVETDSPPPLDGAEGTTGALEAIYEGGGGEVELFGREKLIEQYQYLAERKKAIDKDMDTIKQQLMADLGDNERGYCGRYTVDWRSQTKQTFDAKTFRRDHPEMELNGYFKTSNFRRFTIKEEATA